MTIIDMHSHWATERGRSARNQAQVDHQKEVFGSSVTYLTEQEMTDHFRALSVRVMLDLGAYIQALPLDELRPYYDYAFEMQRAHSDVILGNWLLLDPRSGKAGVDEFERGLREGSGIVGFGVSGASVGVPASDPIFHPYYRLCIEAKAPALISVGFTAVGAKTPGGGGVRLENSHPRYVDDVAAMFPDLTIIAGRPAWPWQKEMIAVMLHKSNVWCELHGWSPKYHDAELKYEISHRLTDRVMFGADYPMLPYERLIADWRGEGYSADVLERVFHGNAERLLAEAIG